MRVNEKGPIELRDMALRTLKQAYENRGLSNVNVGRDSDNFVRFDAFSEIMALALSNSDATANDIFADTASEEALLEHAKSLGIELRPAEKASGNILCKTPNPLVKVAIAAGKQLSSPDGILFEVVTAGSYFHNDFLEVIAVNAGIEGNVDADTPMQWLELQAGLDSFAYVDAIGLVGGKAQDTIEQLRQRIKDRRALASVAGSPEHLISIAENSSGAIQKAFAYPALFGPGSGCIVLQGYYNADSGYSRVIPQYIIDAVDENIKAIIPAEMKITVMSVAEQTTDIAFKLDIPQPIPTGQGSGWIDVSRFPVLDSSNACAITAYTNASQFIVNSLSAPSVGNHIAIWDSQNRKFVRAVVLSLVGQWIDMGTGIKTFEILIDKALAYQGVGMFVSPDCELIDDYGEYVIEAFKMMGPGEATNDLARLPRSFRVPYSTHSYYPKMGNRMIKGILKDFLEVNDIEFSASTNAPAIPTIGNEPNVLVPRNIAFYPNSSGYILI